MAAQNFFRVKGQGARVKENTFDSIMPLDSTPLLIRDPCPLTLPEEAYIMMGDHIAYALRACQQRGYHRPVIACQFAKLLKIACGHENTHAAASELDLKQLLEWAQKGGLPESIRAAISTANTAREIAIASSFDPHLFELVLEHARHAARLHVPDTDPVFLLADYSGNCILDSR
jgi:cobalt-precorrin-5B (C1)-methyltransferase